MRSFIINEASSKLHAFKATLAEHLNKSLDLDITEILPIVLCELKKLAAAPPVIFYMGKVEAPALRC